MKFHKEDMINLVFDDYGEEFEVVETEMVDQRRWETVHETVFKHGGKFYRTQYNLGSTECQESEPFEYDADKDGMITVVEVKPVEVKVTKYVPVPETME